MEQQGELMYTQSISDINDFIRDANSDNYVVDFPYGTYTKARPGETKNEPGRNAAPHAANHLNRQIIQDFVTKYKLDYTADPEKLFLPSLKKALIDEFGIAAFENAEANHRQKWRLIDGIGSFINQTLTWGVLLNTFYNNLEEQARLLDLCRNINNVVVMFDPTKPRLNDQHIKINKVEVRNVKSQDVSSQLITTQKVLTMINASAGSEDKLENGGGVFGDPFYSLTTQEEDLYRTFPFAVQIFVQFVLGKYMSVSLAKENVERFMYREQYAPSNGRCLVLDNGNNSYFFSAANDNTKLPMDETQQFELNSKVFSCAVDVARTREISTIIAGAFGLGVFKGSANSLGVAIMDALGKFHDNSAAESLDFVLAYYIRNPNDTDAKRNFEILTDIFTMITTEILANPTYSYNS